MAKRPKIDFEDLIFKLDKTSNQFDFTSVVKSNLSTSYSYETALKNCSQSVEDIYDYTKKYFISFTRESSAPWVNEELISTIDNEFKNMENIGIQLDQAKSLIKGITRVSPGPGLEVHITNFRNLVMQINKDLDESQTAFIQSELSFADKFKENIAIKSYQIYSDIIEHCKITLELNKKEMAELAAGVSIPHLFFEDLRRRHKALFSRYYTHNIKKFYCVLNQRCQNLENGLNTLTQINSAMLTINCTIVDLIESLSAREPDAEVKAQTTNTINGLKTSLAALTSQSSGSSTSSSSSPSGNTEDSSTSSSSSTVATTSSSSTSSSSDSGPVLRKRMRIDESPTESYLSRNIPPPVITTEQRNRFIKPLLPSDGNKEPSTYVPYSYDNVLSAGKESLVHKHVQKRFAGNYYIGEIISYYIRDMYRVKFAEQIVENIELTELLNIMIE